MSARALSLPRPGSKGGKKKVKKRRAASLPAEYNILLTATLCLLAFGAVMVFSASSTTRILSNGGLSDSAFYLKRTLIFGAVGLAVMHITARHGLEPIRRLTPAILGVSLFLVFAVLVHGSSVNGASRWIGPSSVQLQPSELAKVALILYAADLLARKPKRVRSIEGLMPFLLVAGLTSLVLVQATINLFAVMGLAPLTGVPLPFVSYGNSSLMATLFAVGLILNVARGGTARAGKLRVVEGGRKPARGRSRSSSARSRKSGGGGRGNGRSRRAGDSGRRRASG